MIHCLQSQTLTDRLLIDRMNVAVLALVKHYRKTGVLNGTVYSVLCLTDQRPVCEILLTNIREHRKLNDHKRKLIVMPVLSPLTDQAAQKIVVASWLLIILFSLIIQESCQRIWCNSLDHCLIKTGRAVLGTWSHRSRILILTANLQSTLPGRVWSCLIIMLAVLIKLCLINNVLLALLAVCIKILIGNDLVILLYIRRNHLITLQGFSAHPA